MQIVEWQAASDPAADLNSAFADRAQVVVCDLRAASVSASDVLEISRPVTRYLRGWPGAGAVVTRRLYSDVRSAVRSMIRPQTLVLSASADEGMEQLYSQLRCTTAAGLAGASG